MQDMEQRTNAIARLSCKVFLGFLATAFIGCSSTTNPAAPENPENNLQFAKGGLISINRLAPPVSPPAVLFGFMPDQENKGTWLEISTASKEVSLYEKGQLVQKANIEGTLQVEPGRYQIKHKQRSALWYAGDDYFLSRHLPVPEIGNRERYRRGALGDFALFLDSETPIHSSPIWTPEVGGLKLDDEQMRKIYYAMEVGSVVEVR